MVGIADRDIPLRHIVVTGNRTIRYMKLTSKQKQNLKNAITATVAIMITGLIFFVVAKYAPDEPFSDVGFVEDVSNMHRY